MENSETIQEQKKIALEFLNKIVIADPEAILAGGAVRDWRFGNPATDLDFYFRLPNHYSIPLQKGLIESLGAIFVKLIPQTYDRYKHMNDIVRVFEGEIHGQKCNFMVMKDNSWNWTSDFSNSLCECRMEPNGDTHYSPDFEKAILSKKVKVKFGYKMDNPHILKMIRKFPDFKFEIPETTSTIGDYC